MTARAASLLALTACAAWLRFAAIGFGLPDAFHPAEDRLVAAARELPGRPSDIAVRRAARWTSAAASTAAVPAAYLAALPLAPGAGFAAAAILGAATPAVRSAKVATGDAIASLAVALALAWAARRERGGRAAGASAAACAAALTAASIAATAALSNPCLPDGAAALGGGVASLARGLSGSLGTALAGAVAASFIAGAARREPGTISATASGAVGLAALALPGASPSRVLPIALPALAVVVGAQVAALGAAARRRASARAVACLTAVALAALLTPSLIRDWKLNRLLLRPDTRSLARDWLTSNAAPGDVVVARGGGSCARPPSSSALHVDSGDGGASARWAVIDSTTFSALSPDLDARAIAALDARGALVLDLDPLEAGTPAPVYDPLDPLFLPLQHASSVKRPGPRIRIWRLRPP